MSKFKRMNKIFSGGLFVLMAGALLTGCADNILGGGGSPAGGGSAGPPVVTSVNPANGATKVAINRHITATFNKAMKPATLSSATFTVTGPGTTSVSGSVSYSGLTATFVPINALTASTGYTATVMTGARDLAGDPLASNYVWHFTTGTLVAQAPVYLGSANSFVVLAGSTVTNTGPTILNGDLGLSPGVSTSITGFPPGIVNGVVYSGVTSPAGQAKIDLTNAYTDAASRSTAPVTVTADLGGTTVYPGLYVSGSSMGITGDLTLDAQGDSEAVFIFQMPSSTLTTAVGSPTVVGSQVILTNGAKASNVYWQVGSSATIGAYSIFKGNILSDASISLGTGATLEGRALTHSGAVTLLSNTLTLPAP